MTEVAVTTAAIGCAKLQSNHHHQQTITQLLQAQCPSCRPTNRVKALLSHKKSTNMNQKFEQIETVLRNFLV